MRCVKGWLAVAVNYSDNKAALYKCVDGHRTTEAPSAGTVSLTVGTWYEAKVVVDNDGLAGQRLRFWIDTDGDGDYSDETTLLDRTHVDAVRTAGYVGLYRAAGCALTQAASANAERRPALRELRAPSSFSSRRQ